MDGEVFVLFEGDVVFHCISIHGSFVLGLVFGLFCVSWGDSCFVFPDLFFSLSSSSSGLARYEVRN